MENIQDLPRRAEGTLHRILEDIDLKTIFQYKHGWSQFYASLMITGLRPADLAMLCHWNLFRNRSSIGYYRQGSVKYEEVPVPPNFLDLFPEGKTQNEPIFPALYSDLEDSEFRSEELNEHLWPPAEFLEALLAAAERPAASLMAFKVTHDEAKQGENDIFYRLLISRINDASGVFDMPQS